MGMREIIYIIHGRWDMGWGIRTACGKEGDVTHWRWDRGCGIRTSCGKEGDGTQGQRTGDRG